MKRFFLFILCFSLFLNAFSQTSKYFESNGIRYRIIKDADGASTFGTVNVAVPEFGKYEGDIVIPNVVQDSQNQFADSYKVIGIDNKAFYEADVSAIKLPVSLETMGTEVFMYSSIKSVDIPIGNLKEIGERVFCACRKLETINIPSSIKAIGNEAFEECDNLKDITFHDGLENIGTYAFADCGKLRVQNLPNTLRIIDDNAFQNCYNLFNLNLGTDLKKIGNQAFANCIRLRRISLPEGLKEIGEAAFLRTAFSDVKLPESVREIKKACFAYSKIRRIALPNKLKSIGDGAFMKCSIDSIVIPSNVEQGQGVFLDTKFHVDREQKMRDAIIAKNISKLNKLTVDYKDISQQDKKTDLKIDGIIYSPILYPTEDEKYGLLEVNEVLANVNIPDIIEIVNGPFDDKFIVKGGKVRLSSEESYMNVILKKLANDTWKSENASITLPEGITEIPYQLFAGCKNLKEIIIPKTVKKIGRRAFHNSGLIHIEIPEGVDSIKGNAFEDCYGLEDVKLPNTLKYIGKSCFKNCGIKELILPNSILHIDDDAFSGNALTELIIPENVKRIGYYTFSCKKLSKVTILGNPEGWSQDFLGDRRMDYNLNVYLTNPDYKNVESVKKYTSNVNISSSIESFIDYKNDQLAYVDLGLPSGTLWYKCNLGSSKIYDAGSYYSWGEIKSNTDGKEEFTHESYKYFQIVNDVALHCTKYCSKKRQGIVDNKNVLESIDDAATKILGKGWHIPTKVQAEELLSQCEWEWQQFENVSGYIVKGPNEKKIFLPAGGFYNTEDYQGKTQPVQPKSFRYWTNTLSDNPYDAETIAKDYRGLGIFEYDRFYGFPIRPVKDK